MWRFTRLSVVLVVAVSLVAGGCGGDPTRSSEYRQLAAELDAAQAINESLGTDMGERDLTISALQATVDELAGQIDAAELDLEALVGERDGLVSEAESTHDELVSLAVEIDSLEREVADLEAAKARLELDLDDAPHPEEPFSWSDGNDLSLWVTEAEMTAVLRELSAQYLRRPLDTEEAVLRSYSDSDSVVYEWRALPWTVRIHEDNPACCRGLTSHLLPEGATYGGGWGWRGFVGPHSNEAFWLNLRFSGSSARPPSDLSWETDKAASMRIAAMLLREMNWAD